MNFLQIFTFIAVTVSVGLLTFASPISGHAVAIKRQSGTLANVLDILESLDSSMTGVLGEITQLLTSGDATSTELIPLINQLDGLINSATTSFDGLELAGAAPAAPTQGLASLLQNVLSSVTAALGPLTASGLTEFPLLLASLDGALSENMLGLGDLVPGALSGNSDILTSLVSALQGLDLLQTVTALLSLSNLGGV